MTRPIWLWQCAMIWHSTCAGNPGGARPRLPPWQLHFNNPAAAAWDLARPGGVRDVTPGGSNRKHTRRRGPCAHRPAGVSWSSAMQNFGGGSALFSRALRAWAGGRELEPRAVYQTSGKGLAQKRVALAPSRKQDWPFSRKQGRLQPKRHMKSEGNSPRKEPQSVCRGCPVIRIPGHAPKQPGQGPANPQQPTPHVGMKARCCFGFNTGRYLHQRGRFLAIGTTAACPVVYYVHACTSSEHHLPVTWASLMGMSFACI